MNLQSIQFAIHSKLLRLRALDRIVTSANFAVAMKLAEEDPTPFLDNPDALEAWMDRVLKKDLDDLSIGSLRTKASKLKIPFYTSFNKPNLILKIIEAQRARKAQEALNGLCPENNGHSAEHSDVVRCELSPSTG